MLWQGGGGYGDPVRRDVDAVEVDVRDERVSRDAARDIYGVVVDANGHVDLTGTEARRAQIREDRSRLFEPTTPGERPRAGIEDATRVDDNLVAVSSGSNYTIACGHCMLVLSDAGANTLDLLVSDGSTALAGPGVGADAGSYVDTPIVFRQHFCPSCMTAVSSTVVPAGHPDHPREILGGWATSGL